MFKYKKSKLCLLQLILLVLIVVGCKFIGNSSTFAKSNISTKTPNINTETKKVDKADKNADMIGLWITYLDLNVGNSPNPEKEFKSRYKKMIKTAKENNVNTLIVHVRPFSDSLYPSKFYPWSHLITGKQGKNPEFDPLNYMIRKAHDNNLKFHAWINPLRISRNNIPENIAPENPYNKLPSEYFIKCINNSGYNGICYNPAYQEVRNLVANGVKEIVENYDVDGVHFDDYFYPSSKDAITNDYAYKDYCKKGGKMGIHQWRIKNIDVLIKQVYSAIKESNKDVTFGISPAGVIKNCYAMGADVKTWCSESGYIDYICPQIYWSLDFNVMPFEKTAKAWKELIKNQNINFYCGLALYKVGTEADNGTWKNKDDIIANELKISKKLGAKGVILYSYKQLCSDATSKKWIILEKNF